MNKLKLISSKYFDIYISKQPITLLKHYNKLKKIDIDSYFDFYLTSSVIHSTLIEGNFIDIDTYYKYFYSGMNTKSKSFREIEDLKKAYYFALNNKLNFQNILKIHKISTKTILNNSKYRGNLRDKEVYVVSGKEIIYQGANISILKDEMLKFFDDIEILINRDLTINQVFYFASMIHLIFVHIHPFADGNGRTARLLEKWFLAEKLGKTAWLILSEKLYYKKIKLYYKNINIGKNYETINYDKCLPFLLMLPMALRIK